MQGLALPQAIGESQFAGFLRCVKCCFAPGLGDYDLQGIALRQTIGGFQFVKFSFVASYCRIVFRQLGFAICRALLCVKPLGIPNLQAFILCQVSGESQIVGCVLRLATGKFRMYGPIKLSGNLNHGILVGRSKV